MKRKLICLTGLLVGCLMFSCGNPSDVSNSEVTTESNQQQTQAKEWAIVIHGGTEGDPREEVDEDEIKKHEEGLEQAITIGRDILANGGESQDAVEAVIRYLEDHQEFNAGKGAAITAEGKYELDASFMNGEDLNVGAVTGVSTVKNPISLARLVMEESSHVFYWGSGAEKFADEMEVERVKNTYFAKDEMTNSATSAVSQTKQRFSLGTVGCVAIDKNGNIVAGTSTGGRTGKAHGRIGDSPVIGAGNYANNKTCGVSATGAGEEFIKYTVAHDISALMEYKGLSLQEAADIVVQDKLRKGTGGIIAVDNKGNIVHSYNTDGLYRASADSEGLFEVNIWD